MTVGVVGAGFSVDMGQIDLSILSAGKHVAATSSLFEVSLGGETVFFGGVGLTYDSSGALSGGQVTSIEDQYLGQVVFDLNGFSLPAAALMTWAATQDFAALHAALFSGADRLQGGALADVLSGGAGPDTVSGGDGGDTIDGGEGVSYLRGDAGDDVIAGGSAFDDINGNTGNDTAHGNAGDDWVVGGKDQDLLFGDAGSDIVWGNLGDDTVDGGDGNDQVRGGQGDDSVSGGAGDDYVSGDRGADTIAGGAGADIFHSSSDAGLDRVLDFHVSEGDRVMLDAGTAYTVSQVGADTVIDMGAGAQMVLVGVQLSTLPAGWIFFG